MTCESIHVVVRTRTAKKCTKMQNARAGRADPLFLFIKGAVIDATKSRYKTCNISA